MITKIQYINNSMSKTSPKIFVFGSNNISTLDAITDGIAWRVIKNIGRESIATFIYEDKFDLRAGWASGENWTKSLNAKVGQQFVVTKNDTGIVLKKNGNSSSPDCIELVNDTQVKGGVIAQLLNDGKVIMDKKALGYEQSSIFRPSNRILFGLASEISEGQELSSRSAVLNTNKFFELNLNGISEAVVSLNGNAEDGYHFQIENQK